MKPFYWTRKVFTSFIRKVSQAFVLMMLFHLSASSQCDLEQNGFIFSHPFFSGRSWSSTGDLQITLPSSICGSSPAHVVMTGSDTDAVAVLVSDMGEVSLSRIRYSFSPYCFCCRPELITEEPVKPGIIVDPEHATAAFQINDTLFIVSAADSLSVARVALSQSLSILSRDTLELRSSGSAQGIKVLHSDSLGIWAAGRGGLIRFISHDGSRETSYDLSSTDTLIVVESGLAAAENGRVFIRNGGGFVFERELSFDIATGNSSWLAGNGAIAIRRNGIWETDSGVTDLLNANVRFAGEGYTLEWVDRGWNLHSRVLQNEPTQINRITPDSYEEFINSNPSVYYGHTIDTFTVHLQDPDSNIQFPELRISSYFGEKSLYEGLNFTLSGISTDAECNIGTARLTADSIRIILKPDSVIWEADVETGAIDFTCGNCFLAKRVLRHGQRWFDEGDLFHFISGPDSLRIELYSAVKTVRSGTRPDKSEISLSQSGGKLLCRFGKGKISNGKISVFSLTGRRLASYTFTSADSFISLPLRTAVQSILVQVTFDDGRRIETVVPCIVRY